MPLIYLSGPEIWLLIGVVLIIVAVGHYGRNTPLGYTGTVLLSLVSSPMVGFAVAWYLRYWMDKKNHLQKAEPDL